MPLHDVGYRGWDDPKTSIFSRWLFIAENGFWLAFKSNWIKRIMLFAWGPVFVFGIFFLLTNKLLENAGLDKAPGQIQQVDVERLQQAIESGNVEETLRLQSRQLSVKQKRLLLADQIRRRFRVLPNAENLADSVENDDTSSIRHTVWTWLLMTFFRYPQGFMILFLVGIIGPGLIANDIRSRAFLLYFSKPIGVIEYVVGKAMTLVVFITLITTLPAMALYLFAILLSPDLSVIWTTYDIPFRIIGSSLVLIIPTVMLALALSSLTQETRFAGFAWFAIWALGHGAWLAIVVSKAIQMRSDPFDPDVMANPMVQQWSILSIYNNLGDVQIWVFGLSDLSQAVYGLVGLGLITVISTIVLFRQIRKNTRL